MYVEPDRFFHLTYCTNIHPGNGWSEVYASLRRYAPALKARFAPHSAFGIGLRLSGRESRELLQGDHLQQFQDFLQEHGLYVFTLNGFPYGPFHQQPVKALVHAPDWRDEEVVRFYTHWLLEEGARLLSDALAVSRDEARSHLLEHIRVCFDTCHVAVAYEEPATVLDRFDQIGIKIGKVQISSALKVAFPGEEQARVDIARALEPFAESTYLHQVVQQHHDGTFRHYPDLIEALPHIQDRQIAQWRIHFHVPIFIDHFPRFQSTQDTLADTLDLLVQRRFCRHLEIETYTWSVLPQDLKKDLLDSIAREYEWVLKKRV